jgi:hypothetical protein
MLLDFNFLDQIKVMARLLNVMMRLMIFFRKGRCKIDEYEEEIAFTITNAWRTSSTSTIFVQVHWYVRVDMKQDLLFVRLHYR